MTEEPYSSFSTRIVTDFMGAVNLALVWRRVQLLHDADLIYDVSDMLSMVKTCGVQ
jgi:hypothetical protein